MWLHQRTGQNTAVSVGLSGLLAALLLAGLLLTSAPWFIWGGIAVIGAATLWSNQLDLEAHRRNHRQRPLHGCKYCARELAALRQREQADMAAYDLQRLRDQYRP